MKILTFVIYLTEINFIITIPLTCGRQLIKVGERAKRIDPIKEAGNEVI